MQRHTRRNFALSSRKQKLTHACRRALIDQLESRVLLSTGGMPDPGFGQGGYLKGYQVLAVSQDGSIYASKDSTSGPASTVLLHPDGSFKYNYSGTVPTPPPPNVGPDLKSYLINGNSWVSGNTVTRHYPFDGGIDPTFGNNGTVSDFTSGTGYPAGAFNPENATAVGNQVIIGGALNLGDEQHDFVTAMVRLNSDGSIDHSFGANGIAKGADEGINDVKTYEMLVGPNGNYYLAGEFNGWPLVTEFSPSGTYINSAHLVNSGEDHVYSLGFSPNNVYMLADWTSTTDALAAYDLNLKPDAGFGNNGLVVVLPPDHSSTQMPEGTVAGPMVVDPDGRIFVSSLISYQDGSGGDYAIAYLPDWGANTSVSGFIYNDMNGNGKMDSGDTPLRYWQAFVDLNGNGIYDTGEPTAYADYNGYYKIHGLNPGTYKVDEVQQGNFWTLTEPSPTSYHSFTVASGQVSTGNDFGNYLFNTSGDPSFGGYGAVVGYTAQQVLPNGIIVAKNSSGKIVGLNPDGSVDSSFNPATDIPPAPLPGVYQSDGKRLVLDTSTGTITRYNADGSVDKTFGNNGSVSSYIQAPTRYLGTYDFGQPPFQDTTFTPQYIALQGNDIVVSGLINGTASSGNWWPQLGIQRLHSDGSEDNTFGLVNYNVSGDVVDAVWEGLFVGKDGRIYTAETSGDVDADLLTLSPDGTSASLRIVQGNAYLWDFEKDPFGQLVFVTISADFLTPAVIDGNGGGIVSFPGHHFHSTQLVGGPFISADGKVLVNVTYRVDFGDGEGQHTYNLLVRFPANIPSGSGSISGFIYNDANGNGVHDSDDSPIRYAQAFVDLNGNGKFDLGEPTAYADYNGYYKIYGVAPGTYQVYDVPQSGYTQDAPSATPYRTVTVTSGNTTTGVDFGNRVGTAPQPGSISGTFFYDGNHNGVWDTGEAPSPSWGVYIDANNDGRFDSGDTEIIARANGQYTFNNLAPGTYIVRGTTASGWTQTFPANGGAQVVTVGSGQAVTGVNFGEFHGTVPTANGSISGTFFYDSNHNGVWDSGEPISPYWGVYIDANNDGKFDSGDTELIANGKGQFTFPNLSAGTYVIRGTTASGWTQTSPANGGAQIVTLAAGQNVGNTNFGEYHGIISSAKGSISGTFFYDGNANGVWDAGEAPSPSWGVYIDANDDGVYDSGDTEIIANAHGQYTFSNLSAGTYVIRATTASGWKQTYPANGGAQIISLAAGQNATGVNFGKVRT